MAAPERGEVDTKAGSLPGAPVVSSGVGSPAGAKAAPVGSIYMRTDGGANTSVYVKESGAATTSGWVAK